MAYTFIPTSEKEIKTELKHFEYLDEILELYKICCFYSDITDPLAFDIKNIKIIKISRLLTDKFPEIKKKFNNSHLYVHLGNGLRHNRKEHNLGIKFENDIYNDFNAYLNKDFDKVKYKNFINDFYCSNNLYNLKNLDIISVGYKNNNRPLNFDDKGYIYIGNEGELKDIGKTVADLILISGTTYFNLSLKYGGTTTLFNIGCKKIFDKEEIINNNIKNKNGKILLDTFGIKEELFCNQFNTFSGPGNVENIKYDKDKIEKFISTGLGCDYHLIHYKKNKINNCYISEDMLKKLIKIDSYNIVYPEVAKRINIYIKNKYMQTEVNIRNKDGDIYPSHILANIKLDYDNV